MNLHNFKEGQIITFDKFSSPQEIELARELLGDRLVDSILNDETPVPEIMEIVGIDSNKGIITIGIKK